MERRELGLRRLVVGPDDGAGAMLLASRRPVPKARPFRIHAGRNAGSREGTVDGDAAVLFFA
jgi:hypothetical protein